MYFTAIEFIFWIHRICNIVGKVSTFFCVVQIYMIRWHQLKAHVIYSVNLFSWSRRRKKKKQRKKTNSTHFFGEVDCDRQNRWLSLVCYVSEHFKFVIYLSFCIAYGINTNKFWIIVTAIAKPNNTTTNTINTKRLLIDDACQSAAYLLVDNRLYVLLIKHSFHVLFHQSLAVKIS